MSVNAQVHLSSNENNKRSDKSLKPLFPKREECSHVSCYWSVIFFISIFNTLNNWSIYVLFCFTARKTSGNYAKMFQSEFLRSWILVTQFLFQIHAARFLCGNKGLGVKRTVQLYGCVLKLCHAIRTILFVSYGFYNYHCVAPLYCAISHKYHLGSCLIHIMKIV